MSLSKEIEDEFFAKLELAEGASEEQLHRLREVLHQAKKVKATDIVSAITDPGDIPA